MFNPFQAMAQQVTQQMQSSVQQMAQQAMQKMQAQDPQRFQKFKEMTTGKDENQLKTLAENMAQQRGVNLSDLAKRFGLNI